MKRLAILLLAGFAFAGCADDNPSQQEFREKLDGVSSDPATYDLTVVSCVNDGEFIRYSWGVRNLDTQNRTFAFDPIFTNSQGDEETALRELVGESVGPGDYKEWSGGVGGGERFPIGDVECRFEVVDSVLGAFRDED